MDEEFWKSVPVRQRAAHGSGKTGVLNIALLFGTAAIALSLIITPMLASRGDDAQRLTSVQEDFDNLTTGSVPKQGERGKNYTIRRSVLQETPGSVCIVQGYGVGSDC